MAQPKKQSSPRKTGLRRSHLREVLANAVNAKSPVKVHLKRRQTKKALAEHTAKQSEQPATATAK